MKASLSSLEAKHHKKRRMAFALSAAKPSSRCRPLLLRPLPLKTKEEESKFFSRIKGIRTNEIENDENDCVLSRKTF